MNGPRWVDNNIITQKQREAQYQKHVQKVTDIVKNQKKNLGIDQNMVKLLQSIYNAKSFNMHFNENQRLNQINKQNQMLLDKLIEISEGKQSTIKQQIQTPPLADKQNVRAMSQKRKQAAMQIYTENQQLAQRLLNQRSFINQVQIQKEIEEYEKLKAHMQKIKPSVSRKRNASAQHASNLPPIIQHYKNTSSNAQNRRKLKKSNNSHALNKSAYDINHNACNAQRHREDNLNYLNQSEADIIINQYDTDNIHNSNSMPAYQPSHSANIHNPKEREYTFTSHPSSIRGSQNLTHAAILEEDDQTENYGQKNNQISNFYRNSNRTPSQSQYNNNNNNNIQEEMYQQNQYQNNQKLNSEKQQNQNNFSSSESQNKFYESNAQNRSKNNSNAQTFNNSMNQSQSSKLAQQQNSQQQYTSNRNSVPQQSKQESNQQSNQQSQNQSFYQQQKQDNSPKKQSQEQIQFDKHPEQQNSPNLSDQKQYQKNKFYESNAQNRSKNNSIAQTLNNSMNQSQSSKLAQQQNSQQQYTSNRNSIPQQSKQESNQQSNQQSQNQSFYQQQKQDNSPKKQSQEQIQFDNHPEQQNSPKLSDQQQYQTRQSPQNSQIKQQQQQELHKTNQ
ncbi:hypothetical protein ABPG72_002824 [Tetrahymena utriculariae]